jgi:RNA polymerase sigma-70 factor (ECF subfamily)
MLLHESRRIARTSPDGDIVLLEDQDRALWNQALMAEGSRLARQAWRADQIGPYTIQAAIAAVHTAAPTFDDTDWAQIVGLYDLLLQVTPSPIVEISRAVAIAMRDGPAAGLELIDEILERGDLANYHPAYVVRGDLCRRLGKTAEARTAYEQALVLAEQEPEQRFIEQQLASLSG